MIEIDREQRDYEAREEERQVRERRAAAELEYRATGTRIEPDRCRDCNAELDGDAGSDRCPECAAEYRRDLDESDEEVAP